MYEEPDESYYLGLGRTASDAFLTINGHSEITRYILVLDANNPKGRALPPPWSCVPFRLFADIPHVTSRCPSIQETPREHDTAVRCAAQVSKSL